MTDDPSSPSKKLVRETWSNLCTQDTQESHTRNTASDDSDEDALAVYLMVMALEESKKVKKRKRCTWVQPCLQNRLTLGAYHALLQKLQCSDQKSPQLFAHGRRVVRSTHSEGGATHHTTRDINALNSIMIVGLLGIKQKWKLGIPFNQHFNFSPSPLHDIINKNKTINI